MRIAILLLLFAGSAATQTKPLSVVERLELRDFPSIFQAWDPTDAPGSEQNLLARHDLVIGAPSFFGLSWGDTGFLSTSLTEESVSSARARRSEIRTRNPAAILIAELTYRESPATALPKLHEFWAQDSDGGRIPGGTGDASFRLDHTTGAFRHHLAARAYALVSSGVVDGVLLNHWEEDDGRIQLLESLRSRLGSSALIVVHTKGREAPRSARYINGLYLECSPGAEPAEWAQIQRTLRWADSRLAEPRLTCLEIHHHTAADQRPPMRAATTLALCHSDGYLLFSDDVTLETADHGHRWHPFWDAPLGRPRGNARPSEDGAWHRVFSGGDVVYNPPGNDAVEVRFGEPRRSVATGHVAVDHRVAGGDGDLFLRVRR